MKTFIKTAICAIALSASTVSFAEEKESKRNEPNKSTSTFEASVYVANDATIRLAIVKTASTKVAVRLINAKNEVVYSDKINEKDLQSAYKFDVEQLQNGDYTLEITSDNKLVTKHIHLVAAKVERSVVIQ